MTDSLAEEIDGLADETFLKQDVELRGDAAVYVYIVRNRCRQSWQRG